MYFRVLKKYFVLTDLSDCELTKVPDAVYMMLKETLVESCNLSQNILQSLPRKLCSKFCRIQGKWSITLMQLLYMTSGVKTSIL